MKLLHFPAFGSVCAASSFSSAKKRLMDAEEVSDADDELRCRPLLSLRLGAGTADAEDAIVSASRFSSYSFRLSEFSDKDGLPV